MNMNTFVAAALMSCIGFSAAAQPQTGMDRFDVDGGECEISGAYAIFDRAEETVEVKWTGGDVVAAKSMRFVSDELNNSDLSLYEIILEDGEEKALLIAQDLPHEMNVFRLIVTESGDQEEEKLSLQSCT